MDQVGLTRHPGDTQSPGCTQSTAGGHAQRPQHMEAHNLERSEERLRHLHVPGQHRTDAQSGESQHHLAVDQWAICPNCHCQCMVYFRYRKLTRCITRRSPMLNSRMNSRLVIYCRRNVLLYRVIKICLITCLDEQFVYIVLS